ncbi:MAG: universal stress protein [Oxalobacter formigenes]|nr:universal stress protein [Oxalobacter formigenes]
MGRIEERKKVQKVRHILVASDISESSALAETKAAMLCQRFGLSALELAHVQDTGFTSMLGQILGNGKKTEELITEQVSKDFIPVKKRLLDQFGIDASLSVLFGRPSVEIARYAEKCKADVVVAGTKCPVIGKKFFLGSTTDRLLHITPVPLLIVRQKSTGPYEDALISVDFSENSIYAARIGVKMLFPQARKTFLHTYDIPNEGLMRYANVSADLIGNFREEAKKRAAESMASLIASLGKTEKISQVIQYGKIQRSIEDYVNIHHPDLIIMGKQGRSNLESLLLGSTTKTTIDQTTCDILVVPLPRKEETVLPDGFSC